MLSTESSRFRSEVTDIAYQIAHLAEDRDGLLEADTMKALDLALERLEHSMGVLTVCVAALKFRMELEVNRPANWDT